MKRGLIAVGMVFSLCCFTACGDDNGTTKLDGSGSGADSGSGGADSGLTLAEGGADFGGTDGSGSSLCDKTKLGKHCTQKGQECGSNMTCLLTSKTNGGVCTCQCKPDDASTQLINEDNCPDQANNTCGRVTLSNGQTKNFCFHHCDPALGKNDCEKPLSCNPRSGGSVGIFSDAVCFAFGCTKNSDCSVTTSTTCKTDANPSTCPSGQECIALISGNTAGICAKPGKCDTASGLCAPRTSDFKAAAKVGDPCKDDTECAANMRCQMEFDNSKYRKKENATCKTNSECCSGRCTSGKCTKGLCTVSARNGYCTIAGCAFAKTLTQYACPTGATCNNFYSGGLCMKTCSLTSKTDCRGRGTAATNPDLYGDYECYGLDALSIGGVKVAAKPVCMFGDTISCDLFGSSSTVSCKTLGGQQNTTKMDCRGLDGTILTNKASPVGFCLDETTSGDTKRKPLPTP